MNKENSLEKKVKKLQKRARRFASLPPATIEETHQYGKNGFLTTEIKGLPTGTHQIEHNGKIVFRHYIGKDKAYRKIREKERVKAGYMPYTQASSGSKTIWQDAVGNFLTRATDNPSDVGVAEHSAYVDVTLNPHTPVFQITENIFLIPLKPGKKIPVNIVGKGKLHNQ